MNKLFNKTCYKFLFPTILSILIMLLFPSNWVGNEENYFQLAFRTYSPDSFTNVHAVFDSSKARVVPEYLLGAIIGLLGYELAHSIARILMILLYTAGLTYLFSTLRLRIIDVMGILSLFVLSGQQLMADEWLFNGVEPKTFAYSLVIFAVAFFLKRKLLISTIFFILSTYFHFLVGIFWSFFLLVWYLYRYNNYKRAFKYIILFFISTTPLFFILIQGQLMKVSYSNGLSPDYIYAIIRNPHHIAPFLSKFHFINDWSDGFAELFFLVLVLFKLFKLRSPIDFVGITFVAGLSMLAFLGIAFIDKDTLLFSKLYLFRPNSLFLFFTIISIFSLTRRYLNIKIQPIYTLVIITVFIAFTHQHAWPKIKSIRNKRKPIISQELKFIINKDIPRGDIILVEPYNEYQPEYLQVHRDLERPTLVSWKFVPTNPAEIYKWYKLIQFRDGIFTNGCKFLDSRIKNSFGIKFILIFSEKKIPIFKNCSDILYRDNKCILIRHNPHK